MKHMRICFVGDSFVNGTGDPTFLGWAGRLCVTAQQQGHEITYYNLGIRGQTSRQIAHRWQAEVTARLPRDVDGRIVFSFGANDMTLEEGEVRVPLAESLQNTRSLLATAQQLFPTIMVGPPPLLEDELNQRIASLSQQLTLVCEAMKVPYLEVFTSLQHIQAWKEEVASNDGAHPRAAGYALLAQLVQEWSFWKSWLV
jgi:lysophospholipase L1-like esterase